MSSKIAIALERKYEGEIAEAEANIGVYMSNPVGIGEHPDIVAAVDDQVSKMAEAQEKLNLIEVEGMSGGGVVNVIANAKGDIKRISIDKNLLKPEEKEIIEDLIVAAINDAKAKGEIAAQEEMKSVTGGIPLPPGMKLPF